MNAFSAEIPSQRTCRHCRETFRPARPHARFCSNACRAAQHRIDRSTAPEPQTDVASLAEVLREARSLFHVNGLVTNSDVKHRWQRLHDSAAHHLAQLEGSES